MSIYQIPIHGLIGSPESKENTRKYFTYEDFLMHLNKAQSFDEIEVDIASDGGFVDVADKMIDMLIATKKPIHTKNSGNVCSAASKIFTLPPLAFRSFNPSKGSFLIHNPWGCVEGDSRELSMASNELKEVENEYAKFYSKQTGTDINVIKALMAENIPLTPEQIESFGFSKITNPVINAVAKLHSLNNNNNMEQKEVSEKLSGFEKILQKIYSKLKIKALMLVDANGKELEFPDITDETEIAEGIKANEGGSPANGEYPQPNGSVIVCENGVIAKIIPKESGDMQALKNENENLKAELEKLKAEKTTIEANAQEALSGLSEVKAEFKKFKAQFSKADIDDDLPPSEKSKNKVTKAELEKMFNLNK